MTESPAAGRASPRRTRPGRPTAVRPARAAARRGGRSLLARDQPVRQDRPRRGAAGFGTGRLHRRIPRDRRWSGRRRPRRRRRRAEAQHGRVSRRGLVRGRAPGGLVRVRPLRLGRARRADGVGGQRGYAVDDRGVRGRRTAVGQGILFPARRRAVRRNTAACHTVGYGIVRRPGLAGADLAVSDLAGVCLPSDSPSGFLGEAMMSLVRGSWSSIRLSSVAREVTTVGEPPPEPSGLSLRLSKPSSL